MGRKNDNEEEDMGEPLNVWVVDNEPAMAQIVRRVLQQAGHTVVVFESVKKVLEAFDLIDGHTNLCPHAIVTDFNLGDGTGARVALRAKEERVLRIIIMSGRDEGRVIARNLDVAFIGKPFTRELLLALVEGTI